MAVPLGSAGTAFSAMRVDAVSLQNEISRPASVPDSPQERSMATEILIINQCSVLSDANVQAVIPAVQAQVSEDFAPIWKADATLQFLGRGHRVPRGSGRSTCWITRTSPARSGTIWTSMDGSRARSLRRTISDMACLGPSI